MDKKPIQVLLLEDETAHVEAIRRALESKNGAFKLRAVSSLKQFRECIAIKQPDIALLDMVLPDGNGIDLLSSPPESNAFPMLILTSHGNEQAAVVAMKAGALDYIIKSPETFTNMPRILTGALNQWNMLLSHKKAEQALEISEQNFRSSLENSPLGIRIVSEDGETLYTNRAFLDIYGYQNIEEFKTTPVNERYTPESYLEFHERRGKRRRGEPLPENYEVSIIRKDGAVRQLQVIRKEILWGGKPQYQTIYQDITERKQAEDALQESEDKFRYVFDNSAIGKSLTSVSGEIHVNKAICDMLGYSQEEFSNKSWQDITHPDDIELTQNALDSLLSGEKRSVRVVKRYLHKNGSVVWEDVQTSLRSDKDGKPLYFMTSMIDITKSKQAEREKDMYLRVLQVLHTSEEKQKLLHNLLEIFKEDGHFEAVGIRLREGDDYPYYETNGFPQTHLKTENNLCAVDDQGKPLRDSQGNPVLECMCGNIICGRFDPAKTFFTEGGSFWTNSSTDLLAATTEEDRQARTRNRCNGEGYESVALIPLKSSKKTLGLLQINDTRRNCFTLELIHFYEGLAQSIGIALAQKQAEDALIASEVSYRRLFESAKDGILIIDATTGLITDANPFLNNLLGLSLQEMKGRELWEIGMFADIVSNKAKFEELCQKGYVRYEDLPLKTVDGRQISVEFVSNAYDVDNRSVIQCNIRDITERKQAEEEKQKLMDSVQQEKERLSILVNSIPDEVWFADTHKNFTLANPAALKEFGYKTTDGISVEALAGSLEVLRTDGTPRPIEEAPPLRALKGESVKNQEEIVRTPASGELRYRQVNAAPVKDDKGNIIGAISVVRDVTELKRATVRINELNNILQLISDINQLIVKTDDETELLQKACEQFIKSRQYMLVWIGYKKEDSFDILPAVGSGRGMEYLSATRITWDDSPFGRGPTGTAIKTGKLSVAKEILHDPCYEAWREQALQIGFLSSVALPLKIENQVIGVLNMYSASSTSFDDKELELLSEMAGDLSLGIEKIRQRAERRRIEEALRENESRLREAQAMAHLGFWNWDIKTGDVEWSEEVFRIFGLDPKNFTPHIDSILAFSPWPEDHKRDEELVKRATDSHGPGSYEQKFLRPDKSTGYYFSNFQGNYNANGELISIVGTVLDITERKLAEEALKLSEQNFRNFLDTSSLGIRIRSDEVISYTNQAFLDIFGYNNAEESMLHPPQEYYSPESYAEYLQRRDAIARGETVSSKLEVDIVRKDGTIRRVQIFGHQVPWNGRLQAQTFYNDITELREAQDALKASEKNFRSLINNSTMGIRISNSSGQTLFANHAFLDIFGYYDIDELRQSPPHEHYTPEEKARFLARKEIIARGEQIPEKFEIDIIRKDGMIRHVQAYATGIVWDGKQQREVIYNDITELKLAQDALKATEQNFRNSIEGSLIGIRISDTDGQTLYANKSFLNIFGYESLDEVTSNPLRDHYTSEENQRFLQRQEKRLHGESVLEDFQVEIRRKDGAIRYLQVFRNEVFWNNKQMRQVMYNDVTGRVQAEAKLRESENRYSAIVENLPQKIYLKDINLAFISCNENFSREFKLKPEELNGKTDHDLHPKELADKYEADDRRIITSGKLEEIEEKHISDGKEQIVQVVKAPVKDEKGNITGIAGIYWDITEHKKVEEALQASEQNFRNSMDTSLMGIRIVGKNGDTLYLNQTYLDIFGYKNSAELGATLPHDHYTPESYTRYLRRNEQILRGETIPEKLEVDILRKDGVIRHLQLFRKEVLWNGETQYQTIYNDITERKQAEEALILSEQNFRNSMDSSSTGIYIDDSDGQTLYANQAFLDIFGYENIDEIVKNPTPEHYTPESYAQYRLRQEKIARGEPIASKFEVDIAGKDGAIRHAQLSRREVTWNGQPRFQNLVNDITERKQAEEALILSEQNFRNSMDTSSIGIRISDNQDYTSYVNKTLLDIFGYKDINELMSSPPQDHYSPASHASWVKRHEKLLHGEPTPKRVDIDILRKDGTVRYLDVSMKDVFWDGKLQNQTLYNDITARKQAEEALILSEQNFRNTLDSSFMGINILDENFQITYANQAFLDIFDYENFEEILTSPPQEHYTAESRALFLLRREKYIRGEKLPDMIEIDITSKNGSLRHLQAYSNEVLWNGKQHNQITYNDITELKQAEIEKRELEEKAQIASRLVMVGEMAAGIAHEINNPLTGVIGFSQLILEKKNVPAEIKDELKIIVDGSQRVADIVKRLLTFARQTKPTKTLVNLNELIDNTLKLRDYVLKTANIAVVTRLDEELPLFLVDPGQLQQVFLNMIVNAEQAMKGAHGKGTLTISTMKKGNVIRISFQDDGPGITPENRRRLFEPFFTTKEPGEGTGLGLSLSRAIVLEHGGKINVESEPGHGANFIIELPIVNSLQSEAVAPLPKAKKKSIAEKHGRILVIDDEPVVRMLLETVLTEMGYKMDSVRDAGSAMAKLDAGVIYDVILTDVKMPGMSGIELYSRILEKTPVMKNKIMFITGDVMGIDTKTFLTQNNLTYFAKPFNIEALKEKINAIVLSNAQEDDSTEESGR